MGSRWGWFGVVLQTVACASLAPDADGGALPPGGEQSGGGRLPADGGPTSRGDAETCRRRLFYEDLDGDQYGNSQVTVTACSAPAGFVAIAGDCNDGCSTCRPGGREACDGVFDEDCDGAVDEGCPCSDAATQPCGRSEGLCEPGIQRCTAGQWGDCEGGTGKTNELCDGLDQDCNGLADDPFTDLGMFCQVGQGACRRDGRVECSDDGSGTRCGAVPGVAATVEICANDVDDDCDGQIDEAPEGGCCLDAHCEASERCAGERCVARTYCETRSAPESVFPGDYACLDFDAAPNLPGAPWKSVVTSQGELSVTDSQHFSSPRALRSKVYSEDNIGGDEALLEWSVSGAKSVQSVRVSLRLHIAGLSATRSETGRVELLCVKNGSSRACLAVSTEHGQFAVLVRDVAGPQQQLCGHVDGEAYLEENAWNGLVMIFDAGGGLGIEVGAKSVPLSGCSYVLEPDTGVSVEVGAGTVPDTGFARTVLYDDIEVVVRR